MIQNTTNGGLHLQQRLTTITPTVMSIVSIIVITKVVKKSPLNAKYMAQPVKLQCCRQAEGNLDCGSSDVQQGTLPYKHQECTQSLKCCPAKHSFRLIPTQ